MSLLIFTLVLNQFSYGQSSVLVATVSWSAESDEIKTQTVVFTQQAKEPWTAEVFRPWTGGRTGVVPEPEPGQAGNVNAHRTLCRHEGC